MPRLFIIDHSLISPGGHHYEYDLHVAAAAARAGWEPVLATNMRFAPHAARLAPWRVMPVFRNDAYNRFTVTSGATGEPQNPWRRGWWRRAPVAGAGPVAAWRRLALWLKQRRRLARFVRGCEALFDAVVPAPGDVVFVPTLSEFDLVALARFAARHPPAAAADWHLQFHLNYLDGAEPEQARQQARVAAMRDHFAALLPDLARLRARFHATTAQIAAQYNRMGLLHVEVLDYPVSTGFRPAVGLRQPGPLRVLSAGGARAEKGTARLGEVLRDCWDEFFASGRVQLLVQVERDAELPPLPGPAPAPEAVRRVPFPLSAEDYCALIRTADAGLFLYDPVRYYGRASGVLIEMLCSGIPVIVPAACWLADEIAEANFRHLDALRERAALAGAPLDAAWQAQPAEAPGGPPALALACAVPPGASEALISFTLAAPAGPGHYLALRCVQQDAGGQELARQVDVSGTRAGGVPVRLLVRLERGAARLRLQLAHAREPVALRLEAAEVRFLDGGAAGLPLGAIGLAAASPAEIPRLMRELVARHGHYRCQARAFASAYAELHSPDTVVARLVAPRGAGFSADGGAAAAG